MAEEEVEVISGRIIISITNQSKEEEMIMIRIYSLINLIFGVLIMKGVGIKSLSTDLEEKNNRGHQVNVAKNNSNNNNNLETMLLTCSVVDDDSGNKWYLDTDCSNHICGKKDMFSDMDEIIQSEVKFENNSKIHVMGKM